MSKQTTQKEAIEYIRREVLSNSLSTSERKEIRNLHREVKSFLKQDNKEIKSTAQKFKEYTKNECANGTYDHYADVIMYLSEDPELSVIFGYQNYALNSPTLWSFMEKILDIKYNIVNY